jgi:amino acid transporter
VSLKRVLTLRDLVLFNLVAILGLRWLATAAKAGPASLVLWLLAALLFFVPQGLSVVELSRRYPEEGGIYAWTKRAMGDGHAFICGWSYWMSNVMYFPQLLLSTAVVATYAFGMGESALGQSWPYVLSVTLIALWLAVLLNVVGVRTGRWLQNIGGIGTYLPGVLIVLFGVWALVVGAPSANPMHAKDFIPDLTDFGSLNLWASVAFAFGGLELSATMGDEIENPGRNLPRAVYISAPLVAVVYILGTGALLWLVPTSELNIVSGFLQGVQRGTQNFTPWLMWLVPLAAIGYTIGNVGGVGAWLSGPARIALVIGMDRYFPPAFGKVHPKWGTPHVAILFQAVLATIALLLSVLGKGTTVETVYLILLDTTLLLYFIPFVYLFASMWALRDRTATGWKAAKTAMLSASGTAITVFAMVIAMIPPTGTTHPMLFFAKVAGGAGAFILFGGLLYWKNRRPQV